MLSLKVSFGVKHLVLEPFIKVIERTTSNETPQIDTQLLVHERVLIVITLVVADFNLAFVLIRVVGALR